MQFANSLIIKKRLFNDDLITFWRMTRSRKKTLRRAISVRNV